jgi:flagellar basal-body rod protein FlgC
MKKIILLLLLVSCAHQKYPTDKEIDLYCQDLNVLYQKINVISNNIVNANTTRTPEGGPYIRKIAQNCKNGVCEIVNDSSTPLMKYEPKHPDADKNGYVAYPNINLKIEKADEVLWGRVFETVYASRPVSNDFFFKDPRSQKCFEKYPSLKEAQDYSTYLGR